MDSNGQVPIKFDSFANIINGQVAGSAHSYYGIDPVTKEKLWDVPVATAEDVENAVASANTAFSRWRHTTWQFRTEQISQFKAVFQSYQDQLVDLLVREAGKPRMVAMGEIQTCVQLLDWHIKLKEPRGESYDFPDKTIENKFVPLGVAVAICPWNFPLLISTGKWLPAIQMGNSVIVKPSPFTPYATLKVVELANQIFPPGVVQVLGGDDSLGPTLVEHPRVHKISFTGSIATGKKILAVAAKTVKRVTLELGGNDASIVLPDANIGKAAPMVAIGAFFNTSQVCIAAKRIYVHSSIYRPFLDALVNVTRSFKLGTTENEGFALGPIQNATQYDKVKTFLKDSKDRGYKFALEPDEGAVDTMNGFFLQPAIVDNPPEDSKIVKEEPFGPIVPVLSYDSIEEVVDRANNSNTGLGATVFGTDPETLRRVADGLEVGSVWINGYPSVAPEAQLSGAKESGLGTEFGTLGILAYANTKAIWTFKST
ncbi:uncharacterized protein PV07_01229 [Cladophialophora immunda]|uniref:aldehyde dehydrogenase (NAD(+)) n=1 Tax=Cladophialophora immunda TaxID=569365 RepID=A0A0D2A2A1_9EURO|nr:uncharacterized protein PV07_01229 [Cladophialophora immunda]KIW34451.1 hypothetical protein PV07_01229 [Cladophialophora immunda]